jgi:hypothetical protein
LQHYDIVNRGKFLGEVKRVSETVCDVMTQCLQVKRIYDTWTDARKAHQTLANMLLKTNVKLGGINMQIAEAEDMYVPDVFVA